jgi:hypothetical protein
LAIAKNRTCPGFSFRKRDLRSPEQMSEESSRNSDLSRDSGGDRPAGLDSAISALSRVFAVLMLLMAIGGVGAVGDWLLGTSFLMPIGFALGTLLAVVGMFYIVKIAEIEAKNNKQGSNKQGSNKQGSKAVDKATHSEDSSTGGEIPDQGLDPKSLDSRTWP